MLSTHTRLPVGALDATVRREQAPRNPGIDLLRGLAILLVVFNHLGLRIPLKKTALADVLPGWFLSRLNYNGYEAVFAFLVISGLLITLHGAPGSLWVGCVPGGA